MLRSEAKLEDFIRRAVSKGVFVHCTALILCATAACFSEFSKSALIEYWHIIRWCCYSGSSIRLCKIRFTPVTLTGSVHQGSSLHFTNISNTSNRLQETAPTPISISVTWGCKGGTNAPQILFSGYWVEEGQIKNINIFRKKICGWCKDRKKIKNLRFADLSHPYTGEESHCKFSVLFI